MHYNIDGISLYYLNISGIKSFYLLCIAHSKGATYLR